jgi:hypothetical protein
MLPATRPGLPPAAALARFSRAFAGVSTSERGRKEFELPPGSKSGPWF